MSNRKIDVACPYCGKKNPVVVENYYGQMTPVLCDVDEGGCDCWFMARLSVNIESKGLKIEGEDSKND